MTDQYESTPKGKQGYHFKGTKVQKYLQKHAISSKKDNVSLQKRQYFN